MTVDKVALELPSAYPIVTLREAEPPGRVLQIPVGLPEGTAIAHGLATTATPRPLTHELFATILQRMHLDVVAVRLTGRIAGTYLAELDLQGTGRHEIFACRPSDALAIAVRMPGIPVPVLADTRLFTPGDVEPALP